MHPHCLPLVSRASVFYILSWSTSLGEHDTPASQKVGSAQALKLAQKAAPRQLRDLRADIETAVSDLSTELVDLRRKVRAALVLAREMSGAACPATCGCASGCGTMI